jgi:hypothetical protein
MTRREYILAELRCAYLRAQLQQADITAVAMALKAEWITPEQAVTALEECDAFQVIEPKD